MKSRGGFTLVEVLLVAALIGGVFLLVSQFGSPIFRYFQQSRPRQEAQLQARTCLETLDRTLSNGRASTVSISNSATTPAMQGGQIQFLSVDGSSYTVTWSTAPANSVHLQHTPPGSTVTTDRVLTTYASVLGFAWNPNYPTTINITLVVTVPLNSSGSADSFLTLQLPSYVIHMQGS